MRGLTVRCVPAACQPLRPGNGRHAAVASRSTTRPRMSSPVVARRNTAQSHHRTPGSHMREAGARHPKLARVSEHTRLQSGSRSGPSPPPRFQFRETVLPGDDCHAQTKVPPREPGANRVPTLERSCRGSIGGPGGELAAERGDDLNVKFGCAMSGLVSPAVGIGVTVFG